MIIVITEVFVSSTDVYILLAFHLYIFYFYALFFTNGAIFVCFFLLLSW
jgi:hypothetical protein